MRENSKTTSNVRPLSEIALEIKKLWKKPYYGAVSYFNAMLQLSSPEDYFMFDSGDSIIRYFLANATYWRGEDARRIKKELNSMIKS